MLQKSTILVASIANWHRLAKVPLATMKSRTIILIVVAACVGVGVATIGCCGGLLYWGYKQADASISPQVDELFARMEDGTFADTYDTETTAAFRSQTTREQYADIGSAVKNRLGPLQSKSMRSYNAQFNARPTIDATYAGKFAHGDGTIVVRYAQDGSQWKIEGLRVNSPLFTQDLASEVCPHCGAAHAKDARFCPACGKALADTPESADEQAP
jgi:hypothetical protein